jgi:hypothetical protein
LCIHIKGNIATFFVRSAFDALQSELDTLKGSLGNSDLNLDQLLYAFKQTLPQGPGEGVGKLLNASA